MLNGHNRRRCDRIRCYHKAFIFSLPHPIQWGFVCDVSDAGLGLATTQSYEPGSFVSLALPDDPDDPIVVKVARSNYQPGVGWIVGCVFTSDAKPRGEVGN